MTSRMADDGPSGWLVLVGTQWGLSLLLGCAAWLVTGRLGAWVLLGAWVAGAALWTGWSNRRRRGPMSQAALRTASLAAGVGNGGVSAAVWLASALTWPEQFGAAADNLWVGPLAVAWIGGLCGLALTLCGINAVNAPWGSLNGGGDGRG